ncbi:MAG TPA: response regulator transcription factor [Nitrospira sp.]|nr:response regulator transcription factor [Nitrospira sp.]
MQQKSRGHRREQQNKQWIVPDPISIPVSPSRPIRVFIADGHEVVRAGVCALLEGEKDLEVVGEADNAGDMLSESRRTKPDVVILQSGLSGGSESDMCKTLCNILPSVRIISLMRDGDAEAFRNAVEGGARGYLQEKTGRIELIRAIRAVAKGDSYLGHETADQAFDLLRARQDSTCFPSALHILSPQERRVIALIAEGGTNKEIATKLVLSEKTVKNYIVNIFAKLKIERRAQAAAIYMRVQQHQNAVREEISV